MKFWMNRFSRAFIIFTIICCVSASMEEISHNMMIPNNPYGRPLDTDLLARLLLLPQRLCHPKRNSELINSLLGLPKNMNNAGK
ncbi:PREDICTED: pigment-dispersing hormone type 2 [Ceratosolen solmsi marchali]